METLQGLKKDMEVRLDGLRESIRAAAKEAGAEIREKIRLENLIRVKKLDPKATVPQRKTEYSAGLDLAPIEGGILMPGEVGRFKTGLAIALSKHTVGRIVPRSSRLMEGWYIDGVLDADYRGDCSLQMRNVSNKTLTVIPGERYAQLLVFTFGRGEVVEVEELDATARGEGGFGSTGK